MESWNGSTGNTIHVFVYFLRLISAFHTSSLTLIDFSFTHYLRLQWICVADVQRKHSSSCFLNSYSLVSFLKEEKYPKKTALSYRYLLSKSVAQTVRFSPVPHGRCPSTFRKHHRNKRKSLLRKDFQAITLFKAEQFLQMIQSY